MNYNNYGDRYQKEQSAYDNFNYQSQTNGSRPFLPKSYLLESILVTLFCCLPLGIVGIVYASSVEDKYYRGDYFGAERASREARKFMRWGLFIGIVVKGAIIIAVAISMLLSLGFAGILDFYKYWL